MCALMSLMPPVMSLMIFLTPTCGGGGGGDGAPGNFCFGGIGPPAQDTYL